MQKQPAKRRSSAAGKAGARGSKAAAAAATLVTAAGTSAGATTGPSRQDWRTAKVQKLANAVPIGKQLKVRLCTSQAMHNLFVPWKCCQVVTKQHEMQDMSQLLAWQFTTKVLLVVSNTNSPVCVQCGEAGVCRNWQHFVCKAALQGRQLAYQDQ